MELTLQKLDEIREIIRLVDGHDLEILDDQHNIIIKVPKTVNGISGHFVVVIDK